MVYRVMVFSPRKTTITHEEFKPRYEQYIRIIADVCGDAAPPSHTRSCLQHDAKSNPMLLAGSVDETYDAIATMSFQDEGAWGRFRCALDPPETKGMIEADEAGFWDRERMKVMVVEDVRELERKSRG
ncbi:unnamed protein product [Penicillium nalgiovense]|nr:unnamed protein product [Penicillium nalgiovense]